VTAEEGFVVEDEDGQAGERGVGHGARIPVSGCEFKGGSSRENGWSSRLMRGGFMPKLPPPCRSRCWVVDWEA
jgi:hypothetical protein